MRGLALLFLSFSAIAAQAPERTVTVLAIADWKGDFAVDAKGRGGLAAFAALKRAIEHQHSSTGGSVVAVHTGRFTGSKDSAAWLQTLSLPAPDLVNYAGFSVMGFPPEEREFLQKSKLILPAPVFGCSPAPCESRILLKPSGISWFATGILDPKARHPDRTLRSILEDAAAQKSGFGLLLFALPGASDMLSAMPANVHTPAGEFANFLAVEPGTKNLFYRDPSGPFVCSISGRWVCRVDIRFRGDTVLGIQQNFIDLNGANQPGDFLKPDPVLMDLHFRP